MWATDSDDVGHHSSGHAFPALGQHRIVWDPRPVLAFPDATIRAESTLGAASGTGEDGPIGKAIVDLVSHENGTAKSGILINLGLRFCYDFSQRISLTCSVLHVNQRSVIT